MVDSIGQRGEAIFSVLISKFDSPDGPLFRPQFLGDKWKSVDFVVELEGVIAMTPYFFVQVKTTRQGYTKTENRLKIKASEQTILGLVSYPAPTYIVGIDEIKEKGWLVSANGENLSSLSSLSTKFPLNKRNRQALWNEVEKFWAGYPVTLVSSKFSDPDWR